MNNIRRFLTVTSFVLLAACGGGGGGGGSPAATPTVIGGVASKGIISGGSVKVFALNADGSKGTQLGQGITRSDGTYSVNIGSYSGPVTVEVSGDYTDEATGVTKTVPATAPLRAALGSASGEVSLSVTPLTDLAVRQAGTLTPQHITAANTLISDIFKVDITATSPVAPTTVLFESSQTTQAQKDYTLALAAVSQIMQSTGTDLTAALTTLTSGISSTGMSAQTIGIMSTAVADFLANSNNQTGVTTIADTSLQAIGATSMKLRVVLGGGSVKGVQARITLPAGVVLRADAAGKTLDGVLTLAANISGGILEGKFTPATADAQGSLNLGLATSGTLVAGDIVTITADLAPGTAVPAASAFAVSTYKLVDGSGHAVAAASVSLL